MTKFLSIIVSQHIAVGVITPHILDRLRHKDQALPENRCRHMATITSNSMMDGVPIYY